MAASDSIAANIAESGPAAPTGAPKWGGTKSGFSLFRQFQCVVNFDPEISHSTLDLVVPK